MVSLALDLPSSVISEDRELPVWAATALATANDHGIQPRGGFGRLFPLAPHIAGKEQKAGNDHDHGDSQPLQDVNAVGRIHIETVGFHRIENA